jgi:hypothetical protein
MGQDVFWARASRPGQQALVETGGSGPDAEWQGECGPAVLYKGNTHPNWLRLPDNPELGENANKEVRVYLSVGMGYCAKAEHDCVWHVTSVGVTVIECTTCSEWQVCKTPEWLTSVLDEHRTNAD